MFNPSKRGNNGRFTTGYILIGKDPRDHTKQNRKQAFVAEHEGKHFCQCGCGIAIRITDRHLYRGIPKFFSVSHKNKSESHRAAVSAKRSPRGETHWNWKGGITPLTDSLRKTKQYAEWRQAVLKRDNFKCQYCGRRDNLAQSVNLSIEAHHIIAFSILVATYKHDAQLLNEKLMDVSNGLTLCSDCHDRIPVPREPFQLSTDSQGAPINEPIDRLG